MSEHCSDVLIHIDESLDDDNIHEIEYELSQIDGVYSACVPEKARHLMLVDYDPLDVETGFLLDRVRRHGLHAELIGL
ncbi:MAG: heavy-metal-associated domain-containing protein [Gammaproteobacteria bacterium]|nr:MAG: heavy-metal-associated domain-containing protein [Gammaproteobacteria bacterium]RTZ73511.1 MAG: heavy-metal-associated domain-containing protein [Gammaproteobacteria bacterium]RTZ77144.1 MAG: heavy-metal-associated domain-containing protein [Gammaproteobacteria bacterium]